MTCGSQEDRRPEKLRVLHVVPYFPPDRVGGVGEVVAHLHRALTRLGHDSRVLTTGQRDSDSKIVRTCGTPTGFLLWSSRHWELVRWADVVHMHHGEALGLMVVAKFLRLRTPVLLTFHVSLRCLRHSLGSFSIPEERIEFAGASFLHRTVVLRLRHALDVLAGRLADDCSFISRCSAREVLGSGRAVNANVVYNSVPEFSESRSVAPVEPVELLFVGTYSVRKRVQLLPSVLAYIREERPECRMRVIGFAVEKHPELLQAARELQVSDGFVFEGQKRSEQLRPYYRAAQVLIVPSAYEGLPMVVLEALQNGLPVVATNVSGHPEAIVDGDNGYLVELDSPRAMAEAALRILADSGLRQRMGARGKATVSQRFGIDRQVGEYLDLYSRLIGSAVD